MRTGDGPRRRPRELKPHGLLPSQSAGGADTWVRRRGRPPGDLAAGSPRGTPEKGSGGNEPGGSERAQRCVPRDQPSPGGRLGGRHASGAARGGRSARVSAAPGSAPPAGERASGCAGAGGALRRRDHLLLVVVLAVELLVPVEAGGLQGLFAGGALHALLVPEAVVEPKQKPVRDDPLTALADRLGAHRSACSSNRRSRVNRAGSAPRPHSDQSYTRRFHPPPCNPRSHPGKPPIPANQPNRVLENREKSNQVLFLIKQRLCGKVQILLYGKGRKSISGLNDPTYSGIRAKERTSRTITLQINLRSHLYHLSIKSLTLLVSFNIKFVSL